MERTYTFRANLVTFKLIVCSINHKIFKLKLLRSNSISRDGSNLFVDRKSLQFIRPLYLFTIAV